MWRLFLVFIMLLGSLTPLHAKTLQLDGPLRESIPLGVHAEFYRDSSRQLSLTDILEPDRVRWRPLPRPMLGLSRDALWVRVPLLNRTRVPLDFLIEDRWPLTNFLDFYVLHEGQVINEQKSGDHMPLDQRHVPYRYPVFDVTLPPGLSYLYLRYETNDLLSSRLVLATEATFNRTREVEKLVFGLLLGCLLIMPLYNCMLKDSSYLYYTVYGLLYVVFQASSNGLWFQYGLDHPWLNDELGIFAAHLSVFFVFRFLDIYLDLKVRMPRVAGIVRWFERAALCAAVLTLFHLGTGVAAAFVTNISMVCWLIYTSFVLARKGSRPALMFLIAWLMFVVGDSFTLLGYLGLMEEGLMTQWGMLAGSALESVLVTSLRGFGRP
jgi:hypothetical protein